MKGGPSSCPWMKRRRNEKRQKGGGRAPGPLAQLSEIPAEGTSDHRNHSRRKEKGGGQGGDAKGPDLRAFPHGFVPPNRIPDPEKQRKIEGENAVMPGRQRQQGEKCARQNAPRPRRMVP